MVKVTVSYDQDLVVIESPAVRVSWQVKHPHEVRQVLEELLNLLDPCNSGGVLLVEVDEGRETALGEW